MESPRGVASPLDGEEFGDEPGPAVVSLSEPARGRGRADEDIPLKVLLREYLKARSPCAETARKNHSWRRITTHV